MSELAYFTKSQAAIVRRPAGCRGTGRCLWTGRRLPVTLRYLSSRGGVNPHELADKLGYYKGTGVALQSLWVTPRAGRNRFFALASRGLEVGSAATAAVINSIAGGNDFVAAYPGQWPEQAGQEHLSMCSKQPDQDHPRYCRQYHCGQYARRPSRLRRPAGAHQCWIAAQCRKACRCSRPATRADAAFQAG